MKEKFRKDLEKALKEITDRSSYEMAIGTRFANWAYEWFKEKKLNEEPKMKLKIESVNRGYIIRSSNTKTICTTAAEMLQTVNGLIGDISSRHDEKRIYIIEAPGDKHEDFTEEHASVIWPELKGAE